MKAKVTITYRNGVLDPEAATIASSLNGMGFNQVTDVRRAKLIELDLDIGDKSSAELAVQSMCDKLLANPVIETYAIEISD